MDFLEKTKGLVILLVLFIISSTNASLTFDVYDSESAFYSTSNPFNLGAYEQYQQEKGLLTGPYISQLNDIKSGFNRPFVNYDIQIGSTYPSKSLPAGPRALLMVIASFVCISLVRDRRFWINVLIGLFWAGQNGLNILPNVVSRLSTNKDNKEFFSSDYDRYYKPHDNRCSSGNLEDTQYIGLLRFLAGIPESTISFPLSHYLLTSFDGREKSDNSYGYAYHNSTNGKKSVTTKRTIIISLQSFIEHSIQYTRFYCLSLINDFSESFDFVQLARGPPCIQVRL